MFMNVGSNSYVAAARPDRHRAGLAARVSRMGMTVMLLASMVVGILGGGLVAGAQTPATVDVETAPNLALPRIILIESFAVTHVDEDGTPVRMASYWINLSAPPEGQVTIILEYDRSQIRLDKDRVVLTAANWNSRTTANNTNRVRVYPVPDDVDDTNGHWCTYQSDTMLGQANPVPANEICGDQVTYILHAVDTTASDAPFDGSVPLDNLRLLNENGPNFDNNPNTVDVIIRTDATNKAAVVLTQSFGVNAVDERTGTGMASAAGVAASDTACYWITLASKPVHPVNIMIEPDGQVTTDKTSVTLDALNWNALDASQQYTSNRVCVRARNDDLFEARATLCDHASSTIFGADAAQEAVCGDHLGVIRHTVVSDDAHYGAAVPIVHANGTDHDGDSTTLDVLIKDDDQVGVQLSPARLNILEGGSARVSVRLLSRPTAAVDVAGPNATLHFDADNWATPQEITINVPDDAAVTGVSVRSLPLQITSADSDYLALGVQEVQMVVTDNDAAGVVLGADSIALSEGGATASYQVRLSQRPTANVTIQMNGAGRLTFAPAQLLFTPDNWATPQTVTVTALDDQEAETTPTLTVSIRHLAVSADSAYDEIGIGTVDAVIADNDVAGLVANADVAAPLDEGDSFAYVVALRSRPRHDVTVTLSSGDGLVFDRSQVVLTPENWADGEVVWVGTVDDATDNSPDAATYVAYVRMLTASDDATYAGLRTNSAPIIVADDDVAGVALSTSAMHLRAGEAATAYTVRLLAAPTAPVAVQLRSDADLTVATACADEEEVGCLLFTPDNWNQPQTVTVAAGSDAVSQDGTLLHVVLSDDPAYRTLADVALAVTVEGRSVGHNLYLPLLRR